MRFSFHPNLRFLKDPLSYLYTYTNANKQKIHFANWNKILTEPMKQFLNVNVSPQEALLPNRACHLRLFIYGAHLGEGKEYTNVLVKDFFSVITSFANLVS